MLTYAYADGGLRAPPARVLAVHGWHPVTDTVAASRRPHQYPLKCETVVLRGPVVTHWTVKLVLEKHGESAQEHTNRKSHLAQPGGPSLQLFATPHRSNGAEVVPYVAVHVKGLSLSHSTYSSPKQIPNAYDLEI